MLNSVLRRLKDTKDVLLGNKKIQPAPVAHIFREELSLQDLQEFEIADEKMKEYLSNVSIEFCFSEFGEQRVNAGGASFTLQNRLDPSISTLKKYFPEAKYSVYSDFDLQIQGVNLNRIVASPVPEKDHERYLYRTADYFKFKSLLESDADFCCVLDTDMFVVSEDIYSLVYLTEKFGFCAPYNSRNLLRKDMKISLDTGKIDDLSNALGHSYNQSPMTLWKNHPQGMAFYKKCCEIMLKEPSRASLVMWKAARETGFSPYLLPQQWCVCADDVGIGNEIMLHVGHQKVAEYYHVKI